MNQSEKHRVQNSLRAVAQLQGREAQESKGKFAVIIDVSDTKIHFSFSNNCSISFSLHFVFLSKVMCFSSTIHNWKHICLLLAVRLMITQFMESGHKKICFVSTMTDLISWLLLACLLQKQARNNQTENLAK